MLTFIFFPQAILADSIIPAITTNDSAKFIDAINQIDVDKINDKWPANPLVIAWKGFEFKKSDKRMTTILATHYLLDPTRSTIDRFSGAKTSERQKLLTEVKEALMNVTIDPLDQDLVDLPAAHKQNFYALIQAIRDNKYDDAHALIAKKNENGLVFSLGNDNALEIAIALGHFEIIRLLIDNGARPKTALSPRQTRMVNLALMQNRKLFREAHLTIALANFADGVRTEQPDILVFLRQDSAYLRGIKGFFLHAEAMKETREGLSNVVDGTVVKYCNDSSVQHNLGNCEGAILSTLKKIKKVMTRGKPLGQKRRLFWSLHATIKNQLQKTNVDDVAMFINVLFLRFINPLLVANKVDVAVLKILQQLVNEQLAKNPAANSSSSTQIYFSKKFREKAQRRLNGIFLAATEN